jgi:hypothetical protein
MLLDRVTEHTGTLVRNDTCISSIHFVLQLLPY